MNRIIKLFTSLVGPGAVIAAGTMGAGAVATLILAGAWFRYDLLWVVLFILPLFVIAIDSSSRIGSVNHGTGMLAIVGQHITPSFAWLLLLINVPIHFLIAMGQLSMMTAAFLSLFGMHPPDANSLPALIDQYKLFEITTSIFLAGLLLWLVISSGYGRIQKIMTAMMVVMFFCFLLIALRSLSEAGDILAGFIPSVPDDLVAPGRDTVRLSNSSIIAIVGSAIAPGALLIMPYLVSDRFGSRILGAAYGLLIFFATGVGGSVGPVLGGVIFDKTGSYGLGWLICAAILLVVSVAILALKPKENIIGIDQF